MIYLDHHATTPLDPRVLEAMLPYLKEKFGNAASRTHKYGWDAEEAVETAREQVANLISCSAHQIIFTSGATESNNMVLKQPFNAIVTSTIEHSSITEVCNFLPDKVRGRIGSDRYGILKLQDIKKVPDADLISIMLVNNEIGTIQGIRRIHDFKGPDTLIHSDIAQAVGKISVDVEKLNVDFASLSAHKIYGPKGVGALYLKESDSLEPFMHGGSQEFGLRAGTLNVPAIVGFGKACEIAKNELDQMRRKAVLTRSALLEELQKLVPNMVVHDFCPQVPGSLHISLPCDDMTMLLGLLSNKVAISTASACMSITNSPSRVLQAVGLDAEDAKRSVRLCTGRFNTLEEMKEAARHIADAVRTVNSEV